GLPEAEIDLGGLEARVDRHRDRADERCAVEERQPLLVVAHQDADVIAAPQAHRLHGAGRGLGFLEKLAVRETAFACYERFCSQVPLVENFAQRLCLPAHALPIPLPVASCSSIAASSKPRAPCGSSSIPRSMHCFARRMASTGATITAWLMLASSCSSFSGWTTRATNPAACASTAVRRRPVNMRSFARRLPSTRGRRWVAPTVPRSASGVPNTASGVATMKSQAAAISTPEPSAAPCTTATAGLGIASSAA